MPVQKDHIEMDYHNRVANMGKKIGIPNCLGTVCNELTLQGDKSLRRRQGQVLVMSASSQAHVVASYRLAKELSREGLAITFLGFQKDIESLQPATDLQGLNFNWHALPDHPNFQTVDNEKVTPFTVSELLKESFQPYLEKLFADQKAGVAIPDCIVADRFLVWTRDAAKQLNIQNYVFFSNGACSARLLQAIPQLVSQGKIHLVKDRVQEYQGVLTITGLPPIRYRDLPAAIRLLPVAADAISIGESLLKADGVLVNTFYDFEPAPLDALQAALSEVSPGKDVRILPVGPLSAVASFTDKTIVSGLQNEGAKCLQWLDSRPAESVLYICLGSMVRLSPAQINELAMSLEASQQSFLWVLPKGRGNFSILEEVLPAGFEARTGGRGRVVNGWVPQLQILAHSSLSGFLTHCGWNSLIESITSGVPMLAWPHGAEQHLNCRFAVTVLQTAVEIAGDWMKRDDNVVDAKEFERAISTLMSEEGSAMRMRAKDLKLKAKVAVESGGSSEKALEEFVDLINSRS